MENIRTEKIGNVTLDYAHYPGEDFYCDGAIEDELLAIVKQTPQEGYMSVIREKRSWEVLYHLSDLRENIVEWLPMDKTMKVLEVGSGCGAITGSFSRKAGSVTCVDLSRKRSLINAWRHKDCDNVTIHVGNFQDIEPDLAADYDYVCLIGVFEYGQAYIGGDTPFTDFYSIVKKHVKPGGRIVIAIENKMGLKYWAGCREDHLGAFFSGLEDYAQGGVVRTFTRGGLEQILTACGEKDIHFYYPYPDYKFMTMAYSDRYLPKVGELSNNLRNFDRDRMLLFDEKKVFDMLIREKLFPLYSNSFLVVTGPAPETIYSRFSNDRARHLSIRTDIGQAGEQKYVRKYAAHEAAGAHIHQLAENGRAFTAQFAGSGLSVNLLEEGQDRQGHYVQAAFLEQAVTLEELLDECLQKKDEDGFRALFDRYLAVLSCAEKGELQDFDLIFPNILVQKESWTVIDYEWTCKGRSAKQMAQRALFCYVLENEKRRENPILQKVLTQMEMEESDFGELLCQELAFQKQIMTETDGTERTAVTDLRHLIGHMAVPAQEFFARAERKKVQIFEDYGTGYSPAHSYYLYDAYLADDWIRTEVICPKGVRGIRLDPAEVPCLVRVKQVIYNGRSLTKEQLDRVLVTNGQPLCREAGADSTVLFDDNDPNINVRLDLLEDAKTAEVSAPDSHSREQSGRLVIEAQICWLSAEMLADLQANVKRRKHLWFLK